MIVRCVRKRSLKLSCVVLGKFYRRRPSRGSRMLSASLSSSIRAHEPARAGNARLVGRNMVVEAGWVSPPTREQPGKMRINAVRSGRSGSSGLLVRAARVEFL